MNKQDDKKMIDPPIKGQNDLIKILDLCSKLQYENKKNNGDEVKNQIKEDLGIDQNDKDTYNYYIVDNKLRIDRLIIDGKIANAAITDIDKLMEHPSIAKISIVDYKIGPDQTEFNQKVCILDLLSMIFHQTNSGSINEASFTDRNPEDEKKIKQYKKVFSADSLKKTRYIFNLIKQMEDLKTVKYSSIEDIEKHICINSIGRISLLKEFIQLQIKNTNARLHWKQDDFKFQSVLYQGGCSIVDFDALEEVVEISDNEIEWHDSLDKLFSFNSVKQIDQLIKKISNKKEFWNIVDERIFSDTAFYGYDIFNAQDREKLGIEFEPTELYIVAAVLSFVFGVVPFLFLGFYFIRKAYQSYTFNNKFRWINEKRKQPINLTRETEIMPRNQGNEPIPSLKSDQEIDANNANWDDNRRS